MIKFLISWKKDILCCSGLKKLETVEQTYVRAYTPASLKWHISRGEACMGCISQCIKIKPKTVDLSTRLWRITTEFVGFISQSLVLRSIALGWILMYRNWSISKTFSVEARWPHGYCAPLWIQRSRFEPWVGALCSVLGQDTLLSQCLSPSRCTNGYRQV